MGIRDRVARLETKGGVYNDLIDQHRSISRQCSDRLAVERRRLAETRASFAEIDHARRSLYRPIVEAVHLARACAAVEDRLAADVYVAHDDVALLAADYLATQHGGRLIYDAVEPFDQELKTRAYHDHPPLHELDYYTLLTRPVMIRADARFSTSEPMSDLLRQRHGVPFVSLPNYVERPIVKPSSSEIRQACGCLDTDFLLIYINSIYPASRFEQIIEAMSLCDPRCHLVHVGIITPLSLAEDLNAQVAELGLQQRIHFLPAMPYNLYLEYISACDAALVWLDIDNVNCATNLHNRYLDAVGAGLPILSSENIAFGEVNEKYHLGMIIPEQTPTSLAAHVDAMRDRRDDYLANLTAAQSALRWSNVENRLTEAVAGAKSVAILTRKDPRRVQRIQRQVGTLQRHGVDVRGIGNLRPGTPNGEAAENWFTIPEDIDGDILTESELEAARSAADDERG